MVERGLKRLYHVAHGLEFDPASHAARCAWFLDARFVRFGEDPNGVVRVAENPEVVAAKVGQFLQISSVDARAMQGVDELVWRKGNLWCFRSPWRASQQEGAEERVQGLVRMREGDRVPGRR